MTETYELGYWNVRGLSQPLRFLFEHIKFNYVNKFYKVEEYDKWVTEKALLSEINNL